MSAENYRSLLKWTVALLLALLVAGVAFVYVTEGTLGIAFGPRTLFGWAIPLGVLFVVIAISWFLLAQDHHESRDARSASYVNCASCGQAILREWRMCPYCGTRVSNPEAAGRRVDGS